MDRIGVVCLIVAGSLGASAAARAEFLDGGRAAGAAPTLGDVLTQRYRVGFTMTAIGGPCRDVHATLPVPVEWPEQKVRVVSEDVSPEVKSLTYRTLDDGVKQMVVEIPVIPAGRQVKAIITLELESAAILAPADTTGLRVPSEPGRDLRKALGATASIETNHPKIVKFAREAAADHEGWRRVEAIYDAVRAKVEYRDCELKGAVRALADGWGDCEELTCLFIAACRSQGIPARTVWVEGHCYPEFWLEDAAGAGRWYPCQAAGPRAFGAMPDQLPILQKGDEFRDPDRPDKTLRYVTEFLRGTPDPGAGRPQLDWVREATCTP